MAARYALLLALLLLPAAAPAQWTRVPDVPPTEVGVVYTHAGVLYAGALDAVYTSRDGGQTWARSAPLPAEADGVWALAAHEGRLFAGTYDGVYESADGGTTWTPRSAGLEGLGARHLTALAVHAGFLYAGTSGSGVFRRSLAPPNAAWEWNGEGLPGNVDALAVTGGTLVAGASANGVAFRREGGTWNPYRYVAFDANGPQLYSLLDLGGVLLGAGSHGLFRSLDGGRTWTRFSPGVGLFNDASLTVEGARVYAVATRATGGTYVYTSEDAGETWTFVERVPGALAYSAVVQGGRLFAGRLDGLWVRAPFSTATEEPPHVVAGASLEVGANPFATSTRVAYHLAAGADVHLAVYDARGRCVATLVDGPQGTGRHVLTWAPAGLPSGTYVLRLTAGDAHATRVVQVVR